MKKKTIYTTLVVLGLIVAGVVLMSSVGTRDSGSLRTIAHEASTARTVEDGDIADYYSGKVSQLVSQGPYISESLHEKGDNFLIEPPTDVRLADLVEPEKEVTLLWFSAVWCEVCKRMRPYVAPTVNFYEKDISLKEINLDRNRKLVQDLGIFASPTFIVLDKQGFELFRYNGASQPQLDGQMRRALNI